VRVLAFTVAVMLAAPAAAWGESQGVTIPGRYFSPSTITVVTGDTVTWRNADGQEHDVAAVDGTFASGSLGGRFGTYTAGFEMPGAHPYLCTIHPFMRGEIRAVAAVLAGPGVPVLAGERVPLHGRAPADAPVTVERRADGVWSAGGSAVAGADGAFEVSVEAAEGAVYRAVTALGTSDELALAVTARLGAAVRVRASAHGHARVTVRTTPARPGLVAALQRWSRERYMWRRIDHARLDAAGRARFTVRARGRVRVVLSRVPRGAVLATTDVVRVRDGRRVRVPMPEEHAMDEHGTQDEHQQDDHGSQDEHPH